MSGRRELGICDERVRVRFVTRDRQILRHREGSSLDRMFDAATAHLRRSVIDSLRRIDPELPIGSRIDLIPIVVDCSSCCAATVTCAGYGNTEQLQQKNKRAPSI
jgi:hypothetical protein